MSLRIVSLLIVTTSMMLTFSLAYRSHPVGTGAPDGCADAATGRPVIVQVPANQAVTVAMAELARDVLSCIGDLACVTTVSRLEAEGALRLTGEADGGTATLAAADITFVPQTGFTGVSTGWELVMYAGDGARSGLVEACASQSLTTTRLGTVRVIFEVRNSLPVAIDDAITVPAAATRIDVGRETGVLANDLDLNGDPLVVHSAGTTAFPWGWVDLDHTGAYRVAITDREHLAPAVVRYVVWDQHGSPTSVDHGYLHIDFATD